MVACAAVPTANVEGRTGSAPVRSTASSAATGWRACRHSAASASFELAAEFIAHRSSRCADSRARRLAHPVAVDGELRVARGTLAREVAGHRLALVHADDRAVLHRGDQ